MLFRRGSLLLRDTQVGNDGAKILGKAALPRLRILSLSKTYSEATDVELHDDGLAALASLTALRRLQVNKY